MPLPVGHRDKSMHNMLIPLEKKWCYLQLSGKNLCTCQPSAIAQDELENIVFTNISNNPISCIPSLYIVDCSYL